MYKPKNLVTKLSNASVIQACLPKKNQYLDYMPIVEADFVTPVFLNSTKLVYFF